VSSSSGARDGLSSVTRGTLLLLLGTLCYVGLNFVARVVLTHYLSIDDWNTFSLALTMAAVAIAAGTLGLPSAVARSLPYVPTDAERRSIVRGALVIGAVAAVGAGAVLWAIGPWISTRLGLPGLEPVLALFPIAVAATVGATIIAAIFQGYEDVTPNALFLQVLTPALWVAFVLVIYVLPPVGIDYESAIIAYVVANVATLFVSVVYLVRRLPRSLPHGPGAPGAAGRLVVFAMPLLFVGLMGTLTGNGDTLVLGAFDPTAIGTYSNSLTLARLLQVGIGAVAYIFLPVAARLLRTRDFAAIRVTYVTVTKWMILLSLPLFLLFVFLPARSLDFVYGAKYAAVVLPLQLVVVGAFLTTVLGPAANTQVAFGQTRLLAYNALAAAAIDLGLAFGLVPTYGLTGAAVAWASANVAYAALSLVELAVLTGVHPFRPHFVVPVLVTAIPAAALLALAPFRFPLWSLPVAAVGIAGAFFLVVLATRSVDEGDRMLLGAVEGLVGRPLPFLRRLGRLGLPRDARR
jgi:O-antigen/teichoic acid export membrane protein